MLYLLPLLVSLILSLLPAHGLAYGHSRFHKHVIRDVPKDIRDYHHIARRDLSSAASGVSTGIITMESSTQNYTFSNSLRATSTGTGIISLSTGTAASNGIIATDAPYQNYTFSNSLRASSSAAASSNPTVTVSATTTVSGTTTVTTTVPAYSIFDSAANTYSTIYATQTTTACSATLTGFFTRVTVTDCDQSVTFSTKSSFYLIATTPSAALAARQAVTTSIQSVVSYYVAPWQSIAANTPNDITVVVCTIAANGAENCSNVKEVWATVVTSVPVTQTATLTVSQYFQNKANIMYANQAIPVNAGTQQFSTLIIYTTMTPSTILTASAAGAAASAPTTRTTTLRSTVSQMGNMVTVTATPLSSSSSSSSVEPTTTITQTVQSTLTITLSRNITSTPTPYFSNSTISATTSLTSTLLGS